MDENLIMRMNQKMIHRGPDAGGIYVNGDVGLGHRRLSILDLSENGTQPMKSKDGRFVIAFNGEIYNYLEIKKELKLYKVDFQNDTDTEVIIEAYRRWGEKCVEKFNGMWSFAVYDQVKNTIFLSRDRFGVKPLYVYENEDYFAFASEIKCLLEIFPNERIPDELSIARYLRFQQEDRDEHTFYRNIKNFMPAHNMLISLCSMQKESNIYWRFDIENFKRKWACSNPYREFRNLLIDAIKIRMRSDVKVGSSLSGGLDSSTIVGVITKKLHLKLDTFSSVYSEEDCNEKEFIDAVNKFSGAVSHYIYPMEQTLNLFDEIEKIIYFHDNPLDCASPFSGFQVYKGVGDNVTVLLDGQGSDEILGGYLFFYHAYLSDLLKKKTRKGKRKAIRCMAQVYAAGLPVDVSDDQFVETLGAYGYREFLEEYGDKIKKEWIDGKLLSDILNGLTDDFKKQYPAEMEQSELNKVMHDMFCWDMLPRILHDVDRNSMAHSLEVRLPFLDYRLVEFAYALDINYKIRGMWTKYILRKSMKNYLPKEVRKRRKKMGFPAPVNQWFRDEKYCGRVAEYLTEFKKRGIVVPEILDKYWKNHLESKGDYGEVLFKAVALEMWLQNEIDRGENKWTISRYQ